MKKYLWLIIAFSLILIGCIVFGGVMMALDWDFSKLSTEKYATNEYTFSEEIQNISIMTNTADITVIPCESETSRIVCYEQQNLLHTVTVADGTLSIRLNDSRKWYDYIGIGFSTPKITLYIPQKEYNKISLKASTSDIHMECLHAEGMDLAVTTGDITVSNTTCLKDVKIQVSTGKTNLSDLWCQNLFTDGDTGDITLKNVIAAEKFDIERTTGDVKFESCDAGEISVETDTGNVTGSLRTEKIFIAETDTGCVDVPHCITGGKCEIETDTGNIKITVGE